MSRINGLSETGISTIAWSEENKTLIIAYRIQMLILKNNIILIPIYQKIYSREEGQNQDKREICLPGKQLRNYCSRPDKKRN